MANSTILKDLAKTESNTVKALQINKMKKAYKHSAKNVSKIYSHLKNLKIKLFKADME